jgi:predicted NAD/FAD-binding protein
VTLPTAQGEVTHGVDTGFLVLNERTYPQLIRLLAERLVRDALAGASGDHRADDNEQALPGDSLRPVQHGPAARVLDR